MSGNAEVNAERVDEVYKGIPFDKLADNIPTVAMCKSELVKIILARRKVSLKRCRLKDFGQEGWNQNEIYANSSGWMGGGHDQGQWSNQVANSFIVTRQVGPLSTWTKISSGEESRKDTWGHVTYKYSCTVKVSWDPLYSEREDARCGTVEQ